MSGQLEEIVAEEIGPVFLGDGLENQAEAEQVLGEGDFFGARSARAGRLAVRGGAASGPPLRKMLRMRA